MAYGYLGTVLSSPHPDPISGLRPDRRTTQDACARFLVRGVWQSMSGERTATVTTAPAGRKASPRIYVPLAILLFILAITGFWATYYRPLLSGNETTPAIIELHAAIFVGWLILLIAQAALAATNRMALHMKVGRYAMLYGALLVVIGVVATLSAFERHLSSGNLQRADTILFIGLTDMLTFVPFLGAAWWYRRNPELHKRLIVVATTVLLVAPVHRMHWFLGGPPAPAALVLLIWLAPIYLGMIHDFVSRRIVHPVYVLGILAVFFMKFWRISIYQSEPWRAVGGWFTNLYT